MRIDTAIYTVASLLRELKTDRCLCLNSIIPEIIQNKIAQNPVLIACKICYLSKNLEYFSSNINILIKIILHLKIVLNLPKSSL